MLQNVLLFWLCGAARQGLVVRLLAYLPRMVLCVLFPSCARWLTVFSGVLLLSDNKLAPTPAAPLWPSRFWL